jgi:anti-anti-sigma regulatory factor
LVLTAALLVFSGGYDVTCKQQWCEELASLCSEPNVIIDFSGVTYLDATCVTEVLRMHARRNAKGFDREVVILGQPTVRRLFDMHKMHDVVRVVESLDDAMEWQRSQPVVHYAFCGGDGANKNVPI